MNKQLIKTTHLSKQDIRDIVQLVQIAAKHDGFDIRLYWNVIKTRQFPEFDDLLYYVNGKLVAYLALFIFKEDTAEVNAVVHPQYREQGIFQYLLTDAVVEIKRRDLKNTLLIGHQHAQKTIEWIKALGAQYDHSEIQMKKTQVVQLPHLPTVELTLATPADIELLAQIDRKAFQSDYEQMRNRFARNMEANNRKAFIVTSNAVVIGKVHLRIDDGHKAFIHDLCTLPEFQRKGYAAAMVMSLLEMIRKNGYSMSYLDVMGDNIAAIKLYEKCGFNITASHDFYKINTQVLLNKII